jgi:hypothetical protein
MQTALATATGAFSTVSIPGTQVHKYSVSATGAFSTVSISGTCTQYDAFEWVHRAAGLPVGLSALTALKKLDLRRCEGLTPTFMMRRIQLMSPRHQSGAEQMHRRQIFTRIRFSHLLIALWLSATGMVMLTLFAAASRLS